MIVKRQSCKKIKKDCKKDWTHPNRNELLEEPHDQEPARLENSTNLSPHSNPAHLQLFFKAAGCLDASIVQGQDLKYPWNPVVYDRLKHENITMIGQTRFFSPEHKKEMRVKCDGKNRAHVNMPKGCTSPVFAASGFSLNIPDQPIKSLDH